MRENTSGLGPRQREVLEFLSDRDGWYTMAELVEQAQGVFASKQALEVMRETVSRLESRGLVSREKTTVSRAPLPPQTVWLVRAA